jgi:hypothetical protein
LKQFDTLFDFGRRQQRVAHVGREGAARSTLFLGLLFRFLARFGGERRSCRGSDGGCTQELERGAATPAGSGLPREGIKRPIADVPPVRFGVGR